MSKVRGIRGATTATSNTEESIKEVVYELLDDIEKHNHFDPTEIVSVIFSVTKDLNVIFPAAIARKRSRQWKYVPLLDVQHMDVETDIPMCIRVLIWINTDKSQRDIHHSYLRAASELRKEEEIEEG